MTNDQPGRRAGARGRHPSCRWTATLHPPAEPRDPARFARSMRHPDYPLASAYDPRWVFANLMGPNCLWLAEGLAAAMALRPGQRVLDLGCGAALTSIFLAREHGTQVWAADLWIDPAANAERAREARVADRLFPLRVEAHSLPFAPGFFDAVVSVDAFHYFGTDVRYLSYLAQFVKPGGLIGMVSPGNEVDPDDAPAPPARELAELLGADWFTFRSPGWWRRHWERTRGIEVERAEMVGGGRELWLRYLEANAACDGVPPAEQMDGRMLLSDDGGTLGFCRVIARYGGGRALQFGPGDFARRIA